MKVIYSWGEEKVNVKQKLDTESTTVRPPGVTKNNNHVMILYFTAVQ